jgi:hypothetical protein
MKRAFHFIISRCHRVLMEPHKAPCLCAKFGSMGYIRNDEETPNTTKKAKLSLCLTS